VRVGIGLHEDADLGLVPDDVLDDVAEDVGGDDDDWSIASNCSAAGSPDECCCGQG
jgi:hypothetical protein